MKKFLVSIMVFVLPILMANCAGAADITDLTGYTGQVGQEDINWGTGEITDTFTVPTSDGGTTTLTKIPSPYPGQYSTIKGVWYVNNSSAITDHGAGSGADYTAGNLKKIIDIAGSDPVTIELPGNTNYPIVTNLAVPENVTIRHQRGAVFTGTGNITYSGTKSIDAPSAWIFATTGNVTGLESVDAAWFGAEPAATAANNTTYFARAVYALSSSGAKFFLNQPGTYQINSWIRFTTSNLDIKFGPGVTIQQTGTTALIAIHGVSAVSRISNIHLQGGILDGNSTSLAGIQIYFADDCTIENVETNNFIHVSGGYGIQCGQMGATTTGNNNKIINCRGSGSRRGIRAYCQTGIEISGCDYGTSTLNDYWIEDCEKINIHDNWSTSSAGAGIIVYNAQYGWDTSGFITKNRVTGSANKGIYIYHDDSIGISGSLKDITVAENTLNSITGSAISISGMTADPLTNLVLKGNIINGTTSDAIYLNYITGGTISGNTADNDSTGRANLYLDGVQEMTFSGNTFKNPGKDGTTFSSVYISDAADGTTYCLKNHFTGNTLIRGIYGTAAFNEVTGEHSDYNRFEANYVYGYGDNDDTYPRSTITGADSRYVEPGYMIDLTGGNTPENTNWNAMVTYEFAAQELGPEGLLHIRASGSKVGAAGNKTLRFYLGSEYVEFHPAANNTNDWQFEADLSMLSLDTQMITWKSWSGTSLVGQDVDYFTVDTTTGPEIFFYGKTDNAGDDIVLDYCVFDRLK